MTIQELGEVLHSARLGKGLTLDDVHERTKISIYVLEALEQGNTETLPHPVYSKGFIKDYALLLGLDAEKILQEYLAVIGPTERLELDAGVPDLNVRKIPKSRTGGVWGTLALLVILAAAGWLAVSYVSREIVTVPPSSVYDETEKPAVMESDLPKPQTESVGNATAEEGNGSLPVVSQNREEPSEIQENVSSEPDVPMEQVERAVPAVEIDDEPVVASEPEVASADPAPEKKAVPVAEKNPGDHVLVVTARNDCWVRAVADKGEDTRKSVRYLRPGTSMTIFFTKTLELKLGNAGGVDILLDDRPYPFEAVSGEVKTLELDASAL